MQQFVFANYFIDVVTNESTVLLFTGVLKVKMDIKLKMLSSQFNRFIYNRRVEHIQIVEVIQIFFKNISYGKNIVARGF